MEDDRTDEEVSHGDSIVVACTPWRRGETIEEMRERLEKGDVDEAKTCSIWMGRSDGSRLRESSHTMCRRISIDEEVRKQYSVVSKMKKYSTEELAKEVMRVETVRHVTMGRFRTQFTMRKLMDSTGVIVAREGLGEVGVREDLMEVIDINMGKSNGNRDAARNRLSGVKKPKPVKKRRRKTLKSLSQFKMFSSGCGEGDKRAAERGNSTNNLSEVTERDKFRSSLELCLTCTDFLHFGLRGLSYLRNCGGQRRKQKYVSVSTFRMDRKLLNGTCVKTCIVNVVIEEESRKIRNICIRREHGIEPNREDDVHEDHTTFMCSCHPNRDWHGFNDSTCWHVQSLRAIPLFVNKIRSMLNCGFQQDHTLYFGDILSFSEVVVDGCTKLRSDGVGVERTSCSGFEEGLLPIQMDDMSKEELVRRGPNVAKRWSLWLVFDCVERTAVVVTWKAASSGAQETRMTCTMCRTDTSRKCRHELACEKESLVECDDGLERRSNAVDGEGKESSDSEYGSGSSEVVQEEGHSEQPIDSPSVEMEVDGDQQMSREDGAHRSGEPSGGGGGGDPGHGTNRRRKKRIDYYPKGVVRGFMLCASEKVICERLTELIEREVAGTGSIMFGDPNGTECQGKIADADGVERACTEKRKQMSSDCPRRVTLFTLNHGSITISLLDWVCSRCRHVNRYRGNKHGIFPARHGIAYTVELMYWWVNEMCSNTNSFRAVYDTTSKLHSSPSYNRRFLSGRLATLRGRHRPNRRYANEAIRKFIETIDVDSTEMSTQLYSCDKCEVDLDESDLLQLGLSNEQCVGRKRLRGVVVDGKVVALLKEARGHGDKHDILQAATGISTRNLSNRDARNALRMFLKLTRSVVAHILGSRGRLGLNRNVGDQSRYVLRNGVCYIRTAAIVNHASTKGQKRPVKIAQYITIVRTFINPAVCLCKCSDRSATMNHDSCASLRARLTSIAGFTVCREVMSNFFAICDDFVGPSNNALTEDAGEEDDQSDTDDSAVNDGWVRIRYEGFLNVAEQLESFLEAIALCLIEPVALGFFPFHTQSMSEAQLNRQKSLYGYAPTASSNDEDEQVRRLVPRLAKETVGLHKNLSRTLLHIATCTHGGRSLVDWACVECVAPLGNVSNTIGLQNAVLGRFIRDVMRCGPRNPAFTRVTLSTMNKLLDWKVTGFEKYLSELSTKLHPSSIQYWKNFGCAVPDLGGNTVHKNDEGKTLYVFPGRPRCRNPIDFDKVDQQECTKVYFKGKTVVPSFVTVQCCCAHPKLLGFVLIERCESISAALSSVLAHFSIPPRRVWYDNACNTFDSAIIRIPWYLRYTLFVVDRFHYSGHICCNLFNGNLHRFLDEDRSVAAEVINAIIDKGVSHITYLNGDNVIPFMKVLFAIVNATAKIRDRTGRKDLEDDDLCALFRQTFKCSCTSCLSGDVLALPSPSLTGAELLDFNLSSHGISVFSRDNMQTAVASDTEHSSDEDVGTAANGS